MATRKTASWDPGRRTRTAGILLVAALLAGVAISWKLWLTDRDFPHFPCFGWFSPWPAPWDAILLVGSAACLVGWVLRPQWRGVLGSGLALAVVIALQDQVRWQPWFYLYLLGLSVFLVPGSAVEPARQEGVLAILRLLMVAMYFWSGFHKFGPGFDRVHQVAFEDPLREPWGEAAANLLGMVRPAVPWMEILIAVLLLVPPVRKAGVALAVGTHAWVLVLIGPLGTNYNEVVWPWNLCMAALVPVLFWNAPGFGWKALLAPPCRYAALPILLLAGIMPAFSPERWDRYLSFHLYSGQNQRLMLVLDEAAVVALPPDYRPYLVPSKVDPKLLELRLKDWSYKELKVPFPGEERMNLEIGKRLAVLPFPASANVFFYFDYEFQMQERGWDRFTPAEMKAMTHFPEPRQKLRK